MRRPYGMRLTDEAMVEIGKARERLYDYKLKVQPYPKRKDDDHSVK